MSFTQTVPPIETLSKNLPDQRTNISPKTSHFSLSDSTLELREGTPPVIRIYRREEEAMDLKGSDPKTPNLDDLLPQDPPQQIKQEPKQAPVETVNPQPQAEQTKRTFFEKVFGLAPLSIRVEKALTEDWKLSEIKPRHLNSLLVENNEESRLSRDFFLNSAFAERYHRLVNELGVGSLSNRSNKVLDCDFETLNELGPELIKSYDVIMQNRELIKRYYAGVFREGRIDAQSLTKISNSSWFGPFEIKNFKYFANILHSKFQVPNHVIGPMLGSIGTTAYLPQLLSRRTAQTEFSELLNRMSPSADDGSANAFAPTLQLMILAQEHRIPFKTLTTFVSRLNLRPQDLGAFSAIIDSLSPHKLENEIACPTFAQFLRRTLNEFGPDINQQTARFFLLSFSDYKENGESLQTFLSPKYEETKAFIRSLGINVPSTTWTMNRITWLAQTLTQEKKDKITQLVRGLSEEVRVSDLVFLSDISANEEECALLLDRDGLLKAVKDIVINRIVERSSNDHVKALEEELDSASNNGLYKTAKRIRDLINLEKKTYTERVDPSRLTNIQLSQLLIFHRSLEMPGIPEMIGWMISKDLQDSQTEWGGSIRYDKDMASLSPISGIPGNNKQYRPFSALTRAQGSLAFFHNHALKDDLTAKIFSPFVKLAHAVFPPNKNKSPFAGPSGWDGAEYGDITAAKHYEMPSVIFSKIQIIKDKDTPGKRYVSVNVDWFCIDRHTDEPLITDRGVFKLNYFGDEDLGRIDRPSRREKKRQAKYKKANCPPVNVD